jgi:drug/metabolite transporter superfamily protein YnfA
VTVTGITAKAAVYALTGAFLIRAAVREEARSGVGLDGALSTLAREPYGSYLLAAVAGGFAAYALWCWVRARYENIELSDG